jgi:type I restriction enzyme S subunit
MTVDNSDNSQENIHQWKPDISLPSDWNLMKLKHISDVYPSNVDKKSYEEETNIQSCNYTDVYYNSEINSEQDFLPSTASKRQIQRFELKKGDVLLTKDSEDWKDIGIPAIVTEDLPGILCGYHLFISRPNLKKIDSDFLFWSIKSRYVAFQLEGAATGITRYGLTTRDLANVWIPCPPLSEQSKINSFLQLRTSHIDDLIEKKKRLLDLLQQKKKSEINNVIVSGLDPDKPTKSPETKWLDRIPTHWEVRRLNHLRDPNIPIVYGIVLPGPNQDTGVPIIKGGDCKPEKLDPEKLSKTTPEIAEKFQRSRLQTGELVYEIRGSVGRVVKVPPELEGANLTQDTARISTRKNINTDWLIYALQSEVFRQQMDLHTRGATIQGVNLFDLRRGILPVPPRNEQDQIAQHLEKVDEQIHNLYQKTEQAIDLLEKKRQSLITAAVTGQIDLSNWDNQENQELSA